MSCGCICLLIFSAYLNEAFLCLTRITYKQAVICIIWMLLQTSQANVTDFKIYV